MALNYPTWLQSEQFQIVVERKSRGFVAGNGYKVYCKKHALGDIQRSLIGYGTVSALIKACRFEKCKIYEN